MFMRAGLPISVTPRIIAELGGIPQLVFGDAGAIPV